MTVLMVRYQVREESVAEVEAGIEKAMAAIDAGPPVPEPVQVVGSYRTFA
jgi:hypothetical protein